MAYKAAKKQFRQEQIRARSVCEEEYLCELEKCGTVDQRTFWSLINRQRQQSAPKVRPFEKASGDILTDETEIRDGWRSYFEDLYTPKDLPQFDSDFQREIAERLRTIAQDRITNSTLFSVPIQTDEVNMACKKVKTGKAAGVLGIQPEQLKFIGPAMIQLLTHVFNAMLHLEWRPPALKRGIIIPKAGKDSTIPSNNRGITLMPTIGKLYDSTLLLRADPWFQKNLD